MEKSIKKYAKLYRTALKANGFSDIDLRVEAYEQRLKEMYTSQCAITNHTNRWWFYDGVDQVEVCGFSDFKLLVSKVADYVVNDKTVQKDNP